MIPPVLAAIGFRGAIAIGCCLLVAVLMWRYDAVVDERDALREKVTELGRRVIRADTEVKQAAVVNQAMRDAIVRQNTDIQAARAVVAKLEADARAARTRLAADQEAARRDDTARRARLDKPTAAELNAVLRGVVGAM